MKAPYDYKVGMIVKVPNITYYNKEIRGKVTEILNVSENCISLKGEYDNDIYVLEDNEKYAPIPLGIPDSNTELQIKPVEASEDLTLVLTLPSGTKSFTGEMRASDGVVYNVTMERK